VFIKPGLVIKQGLTNNWGGMHHHYGPQTQNPLLQYPQVNPSHYYTKEYFFPSKLTIKVYFFTDLCNIYLFIFIYLTLPTRVWALLPNPPFQLSLCEETGVPGENPRLLAER
jgi:hypothetical protein